MKFSVHGPFEIPRINGIVDNSAASKKSFWESVEKKCSGLSAACGCYVFVVKARRGALPWYVGRTTRQSFKGEAFGAHQIIHYNHALVGKVGVKAQLFFLAKETPTGRFAKSSGNSHDDIEFLETLMFGIGLNRNHQLRNAKNTAFLKNLVVPGVLNSPQRPPTKSERALKVSLGL